MSQFTNKLSNQARDFLSPFTKGSTLTNLLVAYVVIALPFFVYHEWHLPWHYITLLSLAALICGSVLLLGTLYAIREYWKNPYHPLIEIIAAAVFIFSLWLSEVFHFRAGKVFFFILSFVIILIRVLRMDFYVKVSLATILLVGNGLLSFRALQTVEILFSYVLFKNKFKFEEVDLNSWAKSETENSYWNDELKLGFKIPEDFYFFKPEDLNLEQKTGAGQIAGLIASSDTDANRYPFIRMFYFPSYVPFEIDQAAFEVSSYLNMQISKQEIEDLQEISSSETLLPNLGSKFWTFYDSLRPRYAKSGFILIENPNHDKILLHITENLEKGQAHEPGIESVLKSVRFTETEVPSEEEPK